MKQEIIVSTKEEVQKAVTSSNGQFNYFTGEIRKDTRSVSVRYYSKKNGVRIELVCRTDGKLVAESHFCSTANGLTKVAANFLNIN